MQFDQATVSAAELLARFMEKEQEILDAIISAFGYYPRFTDQFQFHIEESRSQISPRADKAKVISDLMLELGVEPVSNSDILYRNIIIALLQVQQTFAERLESNSWHGPLPSEYDAKYDAAAGEVEHNKTEIEILRQQLDSAKMEIEEYKNKLHDQGKELTAAKMEIKQYQERLQNPTEHSETTVGGLVEMPMQNVQDLNKDNLTFSDEEGGATISVV